MSSTEKLARLKATQESERRRLAEIETKHKLRTKETEARKESRTVREKKDVQETISGERKTTAEGKPKLLQPVCTIFD